MYVYLKYQHMKSWITMFLLNSDKTNIPFGCKCWDLPLSQILKKKCIMVCLNFTMFYYLNQIFKKLSLCIWTNIDHICNIPIMTIQIIMLLSTYMYKCYKAFLYKKYHTHIVPSGDFSISTVQKLRIRVMFIPATRPPEISRILYS